MLCFLDQGLWLHRSRKLMFGRWKSEVKPNNVEIARNFMCALLMAILNDLVVFVLFWQDLMFEATLSVYGRMRLYVAS